MVRYCVILQTMRTIQYVSSERGGWACFCQIHLQSTLSLIAMNTWIFNWHFFCSYAVFAWISSDSCILRSLELKVRMCVLTGARVSGICVPCAYLEKNNSKNIFFKWAFISAFSRMQVCTICTVRFCCICNHVSCICVHVPNIFICADYSWYLYVLTF